MGMFQNKKGSKQSAKQDIIAAEEHFFDEYLREELRNHGRWYFEKVINENGELFKRDLEETIRQVNIDLKEHVASQLDEALKQVNAELKEHATNQLKQQFTEHTQSLKEAQEEALKTVVESSKDLQHQHDELRMALQKNVAYQQDLLHNAFNENKAQIAAMKDEQETALRFLKQSAQELHDHYRGIGKTLQAAVSQQQDMMIESFKNNMTVIVEHYILGALGEQYDIKDQLPAIIQQLDDNKQAIVDDMKL